MKKNESEKTLQKEAQFHCFSSCNLSKIILNERQNIQLIENER